MQGAQILRNEAYIEVRCNDEGCSATQQLDFLRSRHNCLRNVGQCDKRVKERIISKNKEEVFRIGVIPDTQYREEATLSSWAVKLPIIESILNSILIDLSATSDSKGMPKKTILSQKVCVICVDLFIIIYFIAVFGFR